MDLLANILNVVLITGGISAEREVSLSSGKSILSALRELGHNVKVVDPIYGAEEVNEEIVFKDKIKQEYPTLEKLKELQFKSGRNVLSCINSKIFDNTDIAFIGLHGKLGEDGKIQSLLELRGIKYTGSKVTSSALTMDKDFSKIIFTYNSVKTPDWRVYYSKNGIKEDKIYNDIVNSFGFPCVVKPNDEGSTVGLTILKSGATMEELNDAVVLAFKYSEKVIVEKFISGREITVPVIGDEAFPVIEIIPIDGFYDYIHKYGKDMTEYICPAIIDKETGTRAQEAALKAHRALDCSVYSRVDFRLNENGEIYCLEVNTLPGMTGTSLVPKSAKANGMSFTELIEKIINLSLN